MVPGEPPPSDPSAQTWLLPSGQAPGTRHALGTKAQAAELSWGPGPGHLDGQTSCLRKDVARGSKWDKKIWALW